MNIIKKIWVVLTVCYFLSFCGCSSQDSVLNTPDPEAPSATIATYDTFQPTASPEVTDNGWRDAYELWQLEAATAAGTEDWILRLNVENYLGAMERGAPWFNAPFPFQSEQDEAVIDAWIKQSNDYMVLRSEVAVLLTRQSGETYFSFVASFSGDGEWGFVVLAWDYDGANIRVLDWQGLVFASSVVAYPCFVEIAGERIMASYLASEHWNGGTEPGDRFPVHCGTFSVTMESGKVIEQDVSNLCCIMEFLPEGEVSGWSIMDTEGKLIWDNLESTWTGGQ